jgi:hypothetical protein
MSLNDVICKNAKPGVKTRKMSDEKGLYLEIVSKGGKYWRYKYRFAGKEKRLAFGVYPEVTLAEAREKRDEARKLLKNEIDPAQAKRDAKFRFLANLKNSFESIALEWHQKAKLGWTVRHANYVLRRLQAKIIPALGNRAISDITPPELLAVIRAIENRGALDIAHSALQTCGQIFRYAIAIGKAQRDITSDLRGALIARKKSNYARLEARELPEFKRHYTTFGLLQHRLLGN